MHFRKVDARVSHDGSFIPKKIYCGNQVQPFPAPGDAPDGASSINMPEIEDESA